jgi:hypothetical protein
VGDRSLLKHTAGDENPDFSARDGLLHVPDKASYEASDDEGKLTLAYGSETCTVTVRPESDTALKLVCKATATSSEPVYGHVTLIPHLTEKQLTADLNTPQVPPPPRVGGAVRFASGEEITLGDDPLERSGEAWIAHAGWKLHLPEGARVLWPALPHNPYRKQGQSTAEEGRIVIELPFSADIDSYDLRIEIL